MEEFNLDIPKMGYILLVKYEPDRKKDFFRNLIYKNQLKMGFDKDKALYVHSEILGGGPDSVRIAPWKAKRIKIDKFYKGNYIKILRYNNEGFQEKYRYKIAYFYASLCNLKYDFRGILSFVWRFVKQSNRLFFCSEGCVWAYQKIYPSAFGGGPPDMYPPAVFLLLGNRFEVHWEGRI